MSARDIESRNGRLWLDRLLDPGAVTVIGFAAIGILGVLGVATVFDPALLKGLLRLNGEWTIPAAFSAVLLTAGAGTAISIGRAAADHRLPWFGFALVLGWMSLDELLSFHERLEAAVGIDWQILYLPVVGVAAVCWTFAFRRVSAVERALLIAGAAAWLVAQSLELFAWDGNTKRPYYNALMVPEELLEMAGSLLFLVALLIARRVWRTPRGLARPEGFDPPTY